MKSCVIGVEPAVKAGSGAIERIEYQRADKSRGLVTVLAQNIGQIRQTFRQRNAEIIDMVELRISAGEDGGVRGGGQRKRASRRG